MNGSSIEHAFGYIEGDTDLSDEYDCSCPEGGAETGGTEAGDDDGNLDGAEAYGDDGSPGGANDGGTED